MIYKIPDVTPSQNVLDRMHWAAKHRLRDDWYWRVRWRCGNKKPIKIKMRVTITRVSNRLLDEQNLSAGMKYLVDGLKQYGHIYEDSPKWCEFRCDQRKCTGDEEPHMVVQISPVRNRTKLS